MKKNYIKQLFALLLVTLFAGNVNAEEVVFDFTSVEDINAMGFEAPTTNDSGTDWGSAVVTRGGVSLSATDGTTATRIYKGNPDSGEGTLDLRIYKNGTLTIDAGSQTISTIVFTGSTSGFNPDSGTLNRGAWTGSASSVTFTATATMKIKTITVTLLEAGEVAAPIISGNTPFSGSTDVTITGGEGTTIYYTTDGSDPTTSSTSGVSPQTFTLTESATVKAIAALNGNVSPVVSKNFVKSESSTATIADLVNMTEDQDFVTLSLNNAKVVYEDKNYPKNIFVREGDNAILFYNLDDLGLKLNSIVSGTISVGFKNYYGIPEVIRNADTTVDGLTITTSESTELDPITVNISDILSGQHKCDLVLIEDVTIEVEYKEDGTTVNAYYAVDSNNNRIQLYGKDSAVKDFIEEESVDVIGVFNRIQNEVSQLRPIKVTVNGGSVDPGETVADDIDAFKKIGKSNKAKLMLNGAIVLFAKGNDVFVRDQSGAIDFYQTGIDFTAGQVMNGSIYGMYDEYKSLPELKAIENKTNTDDITFSSGTVTPLTGIDLSEIAAYACELVTVNLTISKDGDSYFGEDEDGNKLQVYDKFGIGYNTADIEGKTFNITGIIIPFNTSFEIAPIEDFVGAPDESCENIAAFKQLEKGATAVLKLTDAQVLYNGGNDIYVKDASGAIDFFKSGLELKAGDILNGTIKAKFTVYNNTPELTGVVESDIDITDGTVTPETMDVRTAAGEENICNLVRIQDVTVYHEETTNEDRSKTYQNWYDSSNKYVQFYDKWKIGYELQDGETYTFTGIMVLYGEQPEMYVTVDPTNAGATAISNVNAEQNANAPIYNMAGQRVSNAVKGVFIQNGKKFVIK